MRELAEKSKDELKSYLNVVLEGKKKNHQKSAGSITRVPSMNIYTNFCANWSLNYVIIQHITGAVFLQPHLDQTVGLTDRLKLSTLEPLLFNFYLINNSKYLVYDDIKQKQETVIHEKLKLGSVCFYLWSLIKRIDCLWTYLYCQIQQQHAAFGRTSQSRALRCCRRCSHFLPSPWQH